MSDRFIIMKASRARLNPRAIDAYRGPTCNDTGVEPGKVYRARAEAEADAQKLTARNPVGFVVLALSPSPTRSDERSSL